MENQGPRFQEEDAIITFKIERKSPVKSINTP